jgi:3-oxoacyl-(acyl-carrier-protein) synthase
VIVIAADDVTGDDMLEWVGAGFLAAGAGATDDRVDEAAVPFDKRRHGTLMGMGACALVLESEDAVRERGMRGLVELLSSEANNSAYHGSRLDVDHIAQVMDALVASAERRFGLERKAMAPQTVFMSHETYTPARGGSASAEVAALRHTFGPAAQEVIVANTKGFTGHPMGVGVEDVIAVKILEYGIVPPVPNFKEVDPDLGPLTLSRGGRYPVQYALHLAAGFGSQISNDERGEHLLGRHPPVVQPRRLGDEQIGRVGGRSETTLARQNAEMGGAVVREEQPSLGRHLGHRAAGLLEVVGDQALVR